MFITCSEDGYNRILPEFVACYNAKRSDLNDASCGQLLIPKLTIQTSSASSASTTGSPMAEVAGVSSAWSLVVWALHENLNSARLRNDIQTSSVFLMVRPSGYFCVVRRIAVVDYSECTVIVPDDVNFPSTPYRRGLKQTKLHWIRSCSA